LRNEGVEHNWAGFSEVRRISGLSRATLRRLIGNGQLRTTKVGRATKIDMRSLEDFVENHPAQPRLPGFEEADGRTSSLEKGDQM
jgi:excisionase family DNA binding protein